MQLEGTFYGKKAKIVESAIRSNGEELLIKKIGVDSILERDYQKQELDEEIAVKKKYLYESK